MPIELTSEDRANIAAAWIGCAFGNAGAIAIQLAAEDTYRSGLAAGIERAAKAIDGYALEVNGKMYPLDSSRNCAAAIRALLNP